MSGYPPGAGPTAGQFGGTVYTAPTSDASPSGGRGNIQRPTIATDTAALDSAGRMVASFTAPTTFAWLVRRIVVRSTVRGQALVYVGTGIEDANLVSGTISGDLDENDANQPYLVPEGNTMFVYWVAGGVCAARIEYQEVI